MNSPSIRFISVWRAAPDFTRTPAGRIILDRATGAVTVEAADATSRRLLEGFLSRGAVGYDLVRRFPPDKERFLDAIKAELAFRSREKSGGSRSWGGRDGRWACPVFPLMWVNPRACQAPACRPRQDHERRPAQVQPRDGGRPGSRE